MASPVSSSNHSSLPSEIGDLSSLPNLGGRNVSWISEMKNSWEQAETREKGFYLTAAICFIVALVFLLAFGIAGGGAALLSMAVQLEGLVALGAGCLYIARCCTAKRAPWERPPLPEGEDEKKWKENWEVRNRAKICHENMLQWIEEKKAKELDVSRDEMQSRKLFEEYKKSESNFN